MAVTLTAETLRDRSSSLTLETATALLPVVAASVERYAANAPEAVANEAAIRLAAWLAKNPPAGFASIAVAKVRLTFRAEPGRNALRLSGAMGLLAPWHRPRALTLSAD